MHLILTGATGLVGTAALDALLYTPSITKITILSRREVPLLNDRPDPRVNVIIHKDFLSYPETIMRQLRGVHGVIWALGISQTMASGQLYKDITTNYPVAFAKALQSQSQPLTTPLNFIYISGDGVTHTPNLFTPTFSLEKAHAERLLSSQSLSDPSLTFISLRPAFVDRKGHPACEQYAPKAPGILNVLTKGLGGVMRMWERYWSPTRQLGAVMVECAMNGVGEINGVERIPGGEGVAINNMGIWEIWRRIEKRDKTESST